MAECGVVERFLVGCHRMGCAFVLASLNVFTNDLEEDMNSALIIRAMLTQELRLPPQGLEEDQKEDTTSLGRTKSTQENYTASTRKGASCLHPIWSQPGYL